MEQRSNHGGAQSKAGRGAQRAATGQQGALALQASVGVPALLRRVLRPATAAAEHVAIRSRGPEQWQRPKNIIGAESNDVPEYRRQALEAYLKECEEDCRRIALCFRKTQQGVLAKEIFAMPIDADASI